ncbi:MAG: PhnD/SsuA/transferrin family substrate-binding protein [Micromonosporaceae bacterium]|nr:PhnD/SsuA/transferrin family substrate-binding protein [Micromonosporaceae bacterium]
MTTRPLVLGAVAYDPKVVTIWDGFRSWLREHGLAVDHVLYPHYERMVDDLVAGRLDLAWNSPLAWLRAGRLAAATGRSVRPLVMRDTDRDLTSVVVVRDAAGITTIADLAGKLVATGAIDSPQATLIPLAHLAERGVKVQAHRFDVGVGLHGDHIGGEREAARALVDGEVDAAAMLDANHLLFVKEGVLPAGHTRVIAQTEPYDHCNMTVVDTAPRAAVDRFAALLLGMSYADPRVRHLLDLEGLTRWESGRTDGYQVLSAAVDRCGFYGPDGELWMPAYHP